MPALPAKSRRKPRTQGTHPQVHLENEMCDDADKRKENGGFHFPPFGLPAFDHDFFTSVPPLLGSDSEMVFICVEMISPNQETFETGD